MMVFDYVYLQWELVVIHTADCGLARSSGDVLMITHKLFIVAIKRMVVTFDWPAFSRLCDRLIYYKTIEECVAAFRH